MYPATFQTLKAEIIKNLNMAAHKQAELISRWMEKCTADAQCIANNPFILLSLQSNPENPEFLKNPDSVKYVDYLWKEYGHKEVFIADREGIVKIASGKDILGMNISQKDFFKSAISGAIFTSNIKPSDVPIENESGILETGVPTMLVSAPIRDRSNLVAGTVTLRIDVSEINSMMQNIHLGTTGETYLVNGYGYMLTESRFADDLKKQQRVVKRTALELRVEHPQTHMITKGVSECLKGSDGFDADGYLDYRGVNVLGFWHWMADYGWGVIAEIDVDEGYGPLYQLRNYMMSVFGLVSIGVIIVAFFLGKKISAPIHYISETAKKISEGNYSTRVIYQSDDEVGKLASAINKMAEDLENKSNKRAP